MKYKVYKVKNDADHINKLGELGWEILFRQPLIIGKEFKLSPKSPILGQFVELFEYNANKSHEIRIKLNSKGYRFRKVYMDDVGKKIYKLQPTDNCPIFQWRLEFSTTLSEGEEDPILGMTFGDMETNIPSFCDQSVIDKYSPEGFLKEELDSGAVYEAEVDEDLEAEKTPQEASQEPTGAFKEPSEA